MQCWGYNPGTNQRRTLLFTYVRAPPSPYSCSLPQKRYNSLSLSLCIVLLLAVLDPRERGAHSTYKCAPGDVLEGVHTTLSSCVFHSHRLNFARTGNSLSLSRSLVAWYIPYRKAFPRFCPISCMYSALDICAGGFARIYI